MTAPWVSASNLIGRETRHKKNFSSSSSYSAPGGGQSLARSSTVGNGELMFKEHTEVETSHECHGTIFRSIRNIPRMHLSMNDVPTRISTARFSTIPNQTRTRRSLMRTNIGNALNIDVFTSCSSKLWLLDWFRVLVPIS